MADVVGAPDFETSINDMQDHLPAWWRTEDPASNIYAALNAMGQAIDQLAPIWQRIAGDAVLWTASEEGLLRNFAFAYGLQFEQLPPTSNILAPYMEAWAAEDGSLASAVATLTAFLSSVGNLQGGPLLTFPAGGGGLTFPASGGFTIWQYTAGAPPTPALIFPSDGSGLVFPMYPYTFPSDNVVVNDGTTPLAPASGLTFPIEIGRAHA